MSVYVSNAGLVIVDKPSGMTSHDVVARLRKLLRTRRIGHAGTLDPMATGVLVCGVGRATKILGHLPLDTKEYIATVRLGQATGTDDAEGEPTGGADPTRVGEVRIREAMTQFTGEIQQVPSAVSAVKVSGRRAYELAREGQTPQLRPRPVTVSRFELLTLRPAAPVVDLDVLVECSTGTYVRALARDLGRALRVGGHLVALRRTRVGPFELDMARTLDELAAHPQLSVGVDAAVLAALLVRDVDDEQARVLANGGRLMAAGLAGIHAARDPSGRVIALLTEEGGRARPVFVVRPAAGP